MIESHGLELLALLLLLLSTSLSAAPAAGPGVLDSTVRDCAFKELHHRRRSGVPYEVPLPADLLGVTSSATRTGSRTLWGGGASLAAFQIPPRAVPAPFVRRLALVYENLGSYRHSSAYYSAPPGYSLAAPVVGLLAYNASDAATEVDLNVTGRDPILITFRGLVAAPSPSALQQYYCARFARDGSVRMGGAVASNCTCSTWSTGHFTVVVPKGGGGGWWWWWWWRWVASGCGGVVGLGLLGLVGARIFRLFRDRRVRGREVRAEEGEALDWVWVGKSRMPSAAATRTKPVLETSSTP